MPASADARQLAGKQVLVTGATGFIGSHLVQRLCAAGAQVTAAGPALGWRPAVPTLVRQGRVRFVRLEAYWNPTSLRRLEPYLEEIDYVVHLGYTMPQGRSPLEKAISDLCRNVLGTLRLAQCLPDSVSKFCFASSVMVYGCHPPQPVSESDRSSPASAYAAGKLAAETYLRLHAEEAGLSLSVLRLATVYGPMETDPRAIPNFIRQVLAGKPPIIYGEGDDIRDYVHVSDVTEAMLLALVHHGNAIGVYNVGTGKGHTTRAIAAKIIQLAEAQIEPSYAPQSGIPNQIVCDITRTAKTLGYQPQVDLDQGLLDEIHYFARNPGLWRD